MATPSRRAVPCQADEIERLRLSLGFTHAILAKKAGVKPRTLSRALHGRPVYVDTIARIASALQTAPEALIDRAVTSQVRPSSRDLSRLPLRTKLCDRMTTGPVWFRRVIAVLKEDAVYITAFSTAFVDELRTDQIRAIVGFHITCEDTRWYVVSVHPGVLPMLSVANAVTMIVADGNIIATGAGKRVPQSALDKARALYGCGVLVRVKEDL